MREIRDGGAAGSIFTDNDIGLIIPAKAAVSLTTEGIESFGGHVAELFLLVGNKAGSSSVKAVITQLRRLVLGVKALDDASFFGKARRDTLDLSVGCSCVRRRRHAHGRMVGKHVAFASVVDDVVGIVLSAEIDCL